MLRKTFAALSLIIVHTLCASSALAHDYWLEADSFVAPNASRSSSITLRLQMGDNFNSEEERPLQLARTILFDVFSGNFQNDLTINAIDGRLPLVEFRPTREGTHLFVLQRTPQRNELAPDAFTAYLREEGLDYIVRLRERAGARLQAGRERYTRHIKSLVQIGSRRTNDYRRITGQPLEIQLLRNPYQMKSGAVMPVKILFEGKPLANTQVAALNRKHNRKFTTRTDRNGIARFHLADNGAWLIRLVYMRPCAECQDADWESFWGSYTFALG